MTFGEKLQELRKARGWSQEELAGQIHVSRQALSKWESGGAVPDTENIIALSRLFGVTTDYLLLDEVRDTGQAAPRAAWPKPRRYLLAAAIVGAVGVAAVRFIWAAVAAAMIGEFTSVDMDLIWAEDMVGASVAPVLQRYTLLSVLNTVFMVLLAAGGIGAIFYYPIMRLWEKYGKRGE